MFSYRKSVIEEVIPEDRAWEPGSESGSDHQSSGLDNSEAENLGSLNGGDDQDDPGHVRNPGMDPDLDQGSETGETESDKILVGMLN